VLVAVPTLLVEAIEAADLSPVNRTDVLSNDKAMIAQFSRRISRDVEVDVMQV
jgi:hypothetical protein